MRPKRLFGLIGAADGAPSLVTVDNDRGTIGLPSAIAPASTLLAGAFSTYKHTKGTKPLVQWEAPFAYGRTAPTPLTPISTQRARRRIPLLNRRTLKFIKNPSLQLESRR
jgi:hypothetical protein